MLVALVGVSFLGALPGLGRYRLAPLFVDDSFYYFTIARNLTEGAGFTFDGVHPTNGFHPLWLLVLTCIFTLLPGIDLPVVAIAILDSALIAGAAVMVYRGLRPHVGTCWDTHSRDGIGPRCWRA